MTVIWAGSGRCWCQHRPHWLGWGARLARSWSPARRADWCAGSRAKSVACDGVLAAIGGGVTSSYMWPLGLHLPRLVRLEAFPETPSNIALSAFLIGSLGTSAVKIITTYIEKRAASMTKGSGHEG